jgi:hypothetical protein
VEEYSPQEGANVAEPLNASMRPTGVKTGAGIDPGCVRPSSVTTVGVLRTAGDYRLVAAREISAGERLFRIEGDLTHHPSRYSVQVGYRLHIDVKGDHTAEEIFDRYFWRFMNHSCEANAQIRELDVIATRNIGPWEPVTFNYNSTEWEMAEPFTCHCGGGHCLGQVQGYRFLTSAQRARLDFVAPHLSRHLDDASRPVARHP